MTGNSTSDLQPLIANALADKEWHCIADILKDVGDTIMPERAVRFYQGQGGGAVAAEKDGGDPRPLDERIRGGRRRGVYLAIAAMIKRGMVECKNNDVPTDDREYKLVRSFDELPKRKAVQRPPDLGKELPDKSKPEISFASLVDDLQTMFTERFPNSKDHGDFRFHCRHMKRIILINFLDAKGKE